MVAVRHEPSVGIGESLQPLEVLVVGEELGADHDEALVDCERSLESILVPWFDLLEVNIGDEFAERSVIGDHIAEADEDLVAKDIASDL